MLTKYPVIHRKPPKPIHYDNYMPGQCRFCGEGIFNEKTGKLKTRANWHPACVKAYKALYWPAETRKAVWLRDKGQCAHCSVKLEKKGGGWHVDHIKPLIEAHGDLDYWRLPNLQTLCHPCHFKKTGEEATARAARRREQLAALKKPSDGDTP
jgi:5-methylcytosine-specific restriction endonuclease McrA